MPKFGQALALQLVIAVCTVFALLFAANNLFLDRFYLYEKKRELGDVTPAMPPAEIAEAAERRGWVHATIPFSPDEDTLSESVGAVLARNKMPLAKFWLTRESIDFLATGRPLQKIWNQGDMNMSFLMRAFVRDGRLTVIGTTLAHSGETTAIMNRFLALALAFSLIVISALIVFFVRRRAAPLKELIAMAADASELRFRTLSIRTGDEIEELASRMNWMCARLESAHGTSKEKNDSLKFILSRLSHGIKTPLAILKAHVAALEEGIALPDPYGTIHAQIASIDDLVGRTLVLAKAEQLELEAAQFDIVSLFRQIHNAIPAGGRKPARVAIDTEENGLVLGDRELVAVVIENFLENSFRYSASSHIDITFTGREGSLELSFGNEIDFEPTDAAVDELWKPFVSRSSHPGQTGLGLHLCASILTRHGAPHGARRRVPSGIEFYFSLPRPFVTFAKH